MKLTNPQEGIVFAYTFGSGQLLWSMLWFFMFIIWIWVLIAIFGDIFRSEDLSGGMKAFWTIFVVILPWFGILIYLIVRGGGMQKRAIARAQANESQFRDYVQQTAGSGTSTADQISKLADLKNQGAITDAEFEAQKAKLLA
jgi:Short C-terminal domain/Phospholipase_D-nuclease N-terminal